MKKPRTAQWVEAGGVLAAMVVAVFVNVFVARHYRRWDATHHQLYTLSPATRETLRSLGESVEVDVFLSTADPLTNSVKFLLNAYQAETERLVVKYVDPDRHAA
jgi:ABC-type uncharacterized transport system involved in gliding motility auxiliary subunit